MSNKKYKTLTISDKRKIIQEIDKGEKKKFEIAKEYGIPPSTLSTFLKNRDKIMESDIKSSDKRKRMREPGIPEVDRAIGLWFADVRQNQINLDGITIKAKAEEFATIIGRPDFKASDGWFTNWKRRNDIVFKSTPGESASVDHKSAAAWMMSLDPIIAEYDPQNIFNVDETGLFFKCLPNETFAFKGDPCFGGKKSKERVTILVGANMVSFLNISKMT